MAHGLAGVVGEQVLLRHIGDIFRLVVFGEEVIEGLIFFRPDIFGDRFPPLIGVVERRINIVDHPAEGIIAMLDDLSD